MHSQLRIELDRNGGLVVAANLPDQVPRWAVGNAVRTGELIRVWPGVYRRADAEVFDRRRAALLYCGDDALLSHTSALATWGLLPEEPDGIVHVTTTRHRRIRPTAGLKVHSSHELPRGVLRTGLRVTSLEQSLITAWALLSEPLRTGIVVDAVGERLTTPLRLATALSLVPRLHGRARLVRMIDLMAAGCRSYLEIFGVDRVFCGPGLPHFIRQAAITAGGRTHLLDLFAERERLDVELDGAAWHGSARQRERDIRRDAALATEGVMVVRYSYRRLISEPEAVRYELSRILRSR